MGGIAALDQPALADLIREYLMCGHLIDRSGMPHTIAALGRERMGEVAIDEWQGASPIYTRRTQALLGFDAPTVETIFKGMQFDIGAPPEFLDFRYTVHDDRSGEFHLAHCGALADVEPMGDEYVHTMCHTIEDPTFDATAIATHRQAQVRPVHRPPRQPADRVPHCAWTVRIEPDAEPVADPEPLVVMSRTDLANLALSTIDRSAAAPGDEERWWDYAGPLDPDLRLHRFARPVLAAVGEEIGLQWHLLSTSFLLALSRFLSPDEVGEIGRRQWDGIAGVTAYRLARHCDSGTDLADVATIAELHPGLAPQRWTGIEIRRVGPPERPTAVDFVIAQPTDAKGDPPNWRQLWWDWAEPSSSPFDSIARALNPRADISEEPAAEGERHWRVTIGETSHRESANVTLTKFSTGTDFRFAR